MKIKQVCELTGLTDRAIRYYIEEGLVSPAYTENYMGRRAYDFTVEDVAALNHVATLRKFGFTVEEIRRILTDPQESVAVIAEVRARKEQTVRQEQDNLDALARLQSDQAYTVAELAEQLAAPVREAEVPQTDRTVDWKERLISWLKATPEWLVMLLPMAMLLLIVIGAEIDRRYLQYGEFLQYLPVMGTLVLLPTVAIAVMKLVNRFRFRPVRRATRAVVVGLCLLYMPFAFLCSCPLAFALYESATDDPAHYLITDSDLTMPQLAWEMFPDEPHTMTYAFEDGAYQQTATEVTYHYYSNYDGYYEVCALWRLSPEELAAEIARVEALMADGGQYLRAVHGSFEYLVATDKAHLSGCTPFDVLEIGCWNDVTMFAFNAATGEVRYIACERYRSDPWYMSLDWGE